MAMSTQRVRSLASFIKDNDLSHTRVDVNGKKMYTNYDLSGGINGTLCVPDAFYDTFKEIYAEEVEFRLTMHNVYGRTMHMHYFTETISTVFRMFFDFDPVFIVSRVEDVPTTTMFAVLLREVIMDLRQFYPDICDEAEQKHIFQCVATSAPMKITDANTTEGCEEDVDKKLLVKTGYHFHFPNLYVQRDYAMLMRASVVFMLSRKLHAHGPFAGTDWNVAIDACVYNPLAGLRMLESDKCSDCTSCGGRGAGECQACMDCGPKKGNIWFRAAGRRKPSTAGPQRP